jgi:cytochrome b561
MTGLTYYDPFYKTGPHIHKSIGILLFALVLARLLWRTLNPQPALPVHSPRWERGIALLTHALLYLLLIAIMISGYLISTADGLGIAVFNWFEIPALPWALQQQEEFAGDVHEWLAWLLMALVGLHTLAALKHHFYDKDSVLTRMLGLTTR